MTDDMTEAERVELEALRKRANDLRAAGYTLDISMDGWAVSRGDEVVGARRMRGATPGRPGILAITDRIGALLKGVMTAEAHQRGREGVSVGGGGEATAAKMRARDLKQALYDRDSSLCCQPNDHWLNTVLEAAALKWGDNDSDVLLQAVVDFGALADSTRSSRQDAAQELQKIRDALESMRADLRADTEPAPYTPR